MRSPLAFAAIGRFISRGEVFGAENQPMIDVEEAIA